MGCYVQVQGGRTSIMHTNSGRIKLDGGAATYVGSALLGFLITVHHTNILVGGNQ